MSRIGAREAKAQFAELLERVGRGEEVVITQDGRDVAKLVALHSQDKQDQSRAAAERIRTRARALGGRFDWEEWKAYRDEGRK